MTISRTDAFKFDKETKTILGLTKEYVKKCRKSSIDNPEFIKIIIPAEINGIEVVSIGRYAFYKNKINSIVISEGIQTIGVESFSFNYIQKLRIPNSIVEIGEYAFANNFINSIILSSNLKTIPEGAFYSNNIEEIETLNVEKIEKCAFYSNKIKRYMFDKKLKEIGENAFEDNYISDINITKIYLPEGCKVANNSFERWNVGIGYVRGDDLNEMPKDNSVPLNNITYKIMSKIRKELFPELNIQEFSKKVGLKSASSFYQNKNLTKIFLWVRWLIEKNFPQEQQAEYKEKSVQIIEEVFKKSMDAEYLRDVLQITKKVY